MLSKPSRTTIHALLQKDYFIFVLHVCISCTMCVVWCLERLEEGIRCPGSGVTDGHEPHVGAGNQTQSLARAMSILRH